MQNSPSPFLCSVHTTSSDTAPSDKNCIVSLSFSYESMSPVVSPTPVFISLSHHDIAHACNTPTLKTKLSLSATLWSSDSLASLQADPPSRLDYSLQSINSMNVDLHGENCRSFCLRRLRRDASLFAPHSYGTWKQTAWATTICMLYDETFNQSYASRACQRLNVKLYC